jgi:hypothetical protein
LPEKVVVLSHNCFLKGKPELLERFNEESEEPAISQLEDARPNFLQHSVEDLWRAFGRLEQPLQMTATTLSYPFMPEDEQATMFQRALQTSQSLCAPMESLPQTSMFSAGQDSRLLSNLASQLLFAGQQGGPFISPDHFLPLQHQQIMPWSNSNLRQRFLLESLVQQQQHQHNLQRLQEFTVHQSLVASGQQSPQRNASIAGGDDSDIDAYGAH